MMTKKQKLYSRCIVLAVALMTSVASVAQTKIGGIYYNLDQEKKHADVASDGSGQGGTYSGAVVIPSTVQSGSNTYNVVGIESFTFGMCQDLTSVTIPNSVKNIAFAAFTSCKALKVLNIPASVETIDGSAFVDCSGLSTITVDLANTVYDSRNNCNAIIHTATNELIVGCKNTSIPSTVTRIGIDAFKGQDLSSVNIPNSVTSIGSGAFNGCTNLTSVKIPESVTVIGQNAFSWDSGLSTVELPSTLQKIDDYAFSECGSIWGLVLPENLKIIGTGAFKSCLNIREITIPASVTKIGNDAFQDCMSLEKVTFKSTTPPDISSAIFNKNVEIHVPEGYKAAYESIAGFSSFTIIDDVKVTENAETTGIATLNSNLSSLNSKIFTLNGKRISAPRKGVNIVNGKKIILK